jgi:hypothetical protein
MEGDKRNRRWDMAVLFFLLGFFLFLDSDSFAQTYKYVDQKGTICFTDNPPSFLFRDEVANEEAKPKQLTLHQGRTRPQIKDILQLGQEMLEKELAKPTGKQNLRLIKELGENLYGEVSGRKAKEAQASSKR